MAKGKELVEKFQMLLFITSYALMNVDNNSSK